MIETLVKWDNANKIQTKTYPHTLWMSNICILAAEDYNDLMLQFTKYLNNAFGVDKWLIEVTDNHYAVHNRTKKHMFADFMYRNRNEVSNTNKNALQTETY